MTLHRINQNVTSIFTPKEIESITLKYSGASYIGDFCLKHANGDWANFPAAVFYQPKPEKPEYSNYFALYFTIDSQLMITNGKSAVEGTFNGIVADDGEVIFSRWRHDYHSSADESVTVDGGRDYLRYSIGTTSKHKTVDTVPHVSVSVVNGQFVVTTPE